MQPIIARCWPSERQWVTIGLFFMALFMMLLAREDKTLWDNKTFAMLLQGIVLTAIISMVAGFHFTANKADEAKTENTGKAFDAITATANAATEAKE